MKDLVLSISGLEYEFYSGPSTAGYSHSITSISALTSTLDPLEPFVDSSPFQIELAADASTDEGGYNVVKQTRLRDVFARDPVSIGSLAASFRTGAYTMRIDYSSGLVADTYVSIGASSYWISGGTLVSGTTYDVDVDAEIGQLSNQLVDAELGVAPEVTLYPRAWKGRICWLSLIGESNWRVCYLTDNPRFTLGSVVLSLAPIDARVRDHHVSALEPKVAHFADASRSYVQGRKSKRMVFYGTCSDSPIYSAGTMSSASSYTIPSGQNYAALSAAVQQGTTALLGGALMPTWSFLAGPTRPPIFKNSTGMTALTGRSNDVMNISTSVTGDPFTFRILPSMRLMLPSASTSQFNQPYDIYTRLNNQTRFDPLVRLQYNGLASVAECYAYPYATITYYPTLYLGFIWQQNELDNRLQHQPALYKSFANALVANYAGGNRACASCADSEQGFDELWVNECDLYSVKPITAPNTHLYQSIYAAGSELSGGGKKVSPVTFHAATYNVDQYVTALQLACARNWWCPGETDMILDTEFGAEDDEFWVECEWTEDGENYLKRKFKLRQGSTLSSGKVSYIVGEGLRQDALRNIAGIGDWFGYRATFTRDTSFRSSLAGALIYTYLTSTSDYASLMLDPYNIDTNSFYRNESGLMLVDEYVFDDAEKLDENLGPLLALSQTAISYINDPSLSYRYRIKRAWIGEPIKNETAYDITEDELLDIPVAELEEHIVAEYKLSFANDKSVTYADRVAQTLFQAEKTFELDLSSSTLRSNQSPQSLANNAAATLASLVNRFGAAYMTYSFSIPFDIGHTIAPGSLVLLTCSRVVGAGIVPAPNQLACRVLDVTQDYMAQTTRLKVKASDHRVGQYQYGTLIYSGWSTATLAVQDASWVTNGEAHIIGNGTYTVSSHTSTTITYSSTVSYYATSLRRSTGLSTRFSNTSDRLA